MHLAGIFFITKALCAFIGGLAATGARHESFLQAGRFAPRLARQVAGAAARVLEPHQHHQRPQRRDQYEQRPQYRPVQYEQRPQYRTQTRVMVPDRRPTAAAAARDQRFRRSDDFLVRQGRPAVQPNALPFQSDITRAPTPQVRQTRAFHALEEKPPENKAAEEIGDAINELATAATAIGEARRSTAVTALSSEVVQSLLALQRFRSPQLGQEVQSLPFEIAMAEVYTPGEKQIQVRRVSATLRRFVKLNARVAVFELEATKQPLTSLMPGLHNLRLGFGSLHGEQTAVQPAAVIAAAAEGVRNVATGFKVLDKIQKSQGYSNATEASEKEALALPLFGADLPAFGQQYAWVGNAVYAPVAAITPAYECTVRELFEQATNVSGSTEAVSQATPEAPQAAVAPLSVGAREFIALKALTAVCNLHYSGFVHSGLALESIVISPRGNVYLSDLEGALTVGDEEACHPPPPVPTPTASSQAGEGLQQQPSSSTGDLPPTEAATGIGSEAAPLNQGLSSASGPTASCPIDEMRLQQKMAAESVALGIVLYEMLTAGSSLPFGLTKGPAAMEAIAALQQGVFTPNEGAPSVEAKLQELGVSSKWQMCISALLSSNKRLTAIEAASAYFPEATPKAAQSVPGLQG